MTTKSLTKMEVWHRDYNLKRKHNLEELPEDKAVFGIFAIVDEQPVNCRYVGETENLRDSVKQLYEEPQGEGLKKFMQGPWIQLIQYEFMPDSSESQRQVVLEDWKNTFHPAIDEEGEYPGYYS